MSVELAQIETRNTILTHSSESAFKACPRRYYLSYVLGLRPEHSSDALRIGAAFHYGLEALKRGEDEHAAVKSVQLAYADATCPPWLTSEEYEVEQATASAMVRGYARRYAGDQILKTVAIELPFALPIVNPSTGCRARNFYNGGKIDWIAELPDGGLALVDHKTTSDDITPGSDYWRRMLLDGQISRYVLAARSMGYDVRTTIYDVVKKPNIRPKAVAKADRALATSQGHYFDLPLTSACPERETPAMYGARLAADMVERPSFYFARMEIPRLDSDLEEFRAESWAMQKMIRECETNQKQWGKAAWPRNTNACTSPYRCQFLDVCRGVNGDPEELIPVGFKKSGAWHPELTNSF
jgi:hypothetical protein